MKVLHFQKSLKEHHNFKKMIIVSAKFTDHAKKLLTLHHSLIKPPSSRSILVLSTSLFKQRCPKYCREAHQQFSHSNVACLFPEIPEVHKIVAAVSNPRTLLFNCRCCCCFFQKTSKQTKPNQTPFSLKIIPWPTTQSSASHLHLEAITHY